MVVSDATTLIILFDLDKKKYLYNLFEKVYIPQKVYEEISAKKSIELDSFFEIVEVDESELLKSLRAILDDGESEAISFAKEKNLPLIIDEKKGRKVAGNLDLKIIGLLGILMLNIQRGHIAKKDALVFLQSAIKNGYRISTKLINQFKEQI